ncbi:MAG: hypothetical protein JJE17_05760 [Peptostreptococcaceae bacterium]|nr:hypothetical protein [Peptostreptococcaceae bacterium]
MRELNNLYSASILLILLFFSTTSLISETSNVSIARKGLSVIIENNLIRINYNLSKGTYSAFNKSKNTTCISEAFFSLNEFRSQDDYIHSWSSVRVKDELGIGKKLIISSRKMDSPTLILEITVYEDKGFFVVNSGVINSTGRELKIKKFSPLTGKAFEGFTFNNYKTLDGESGGYQTHVSSKDSMNCFNNLLVTFGERGMSKKSLVIGGLTYNEFQKFSSVVNLKTHLNISLTANDPVGKLVDAGSEYILNDKFYVDFTTDNRFKALENYGFALRDANHCKISGIDYPILNLWMTQWEHGGNDEPKNNTPGSIWAMEDVVKSGFLKYSKVGIRLEPDDYSNPNNQQGWWDDKHWQLYPSGGFLEPYETALKWGRGIEKLGGVPFIYFQAGRRSEDYCKTYPEHILFNNPFKLRSRGGIEWWNNGKGDLWWGYDYTDPEFIKHMKEVYKNLKNAGIKGIKFDYPETAWAYDGGFEDKYATTASAYRNIYKLAFDGLGEGCDIHERLPRNGDINLGVTTTFRAQADNDLLLPPFASKTGLRWYKNRVAINFDIDAKNPFDVVPFGSRDGVQAMFTMTYITSGRLEISKYFGEMTPEQLFDLSRVVPSYTAAKSARPIDAFSGVEYPQIYDFEVNPGWHLLTFYNTKAHGAKWPVRWPDWYKQLESIPVESTVKVNLGDATDEGGLGLDISKSYYIWDFWNWQFIGKFSGKDELEQVLRPGEARVFAIHEMKSNPQFISTNRHIMQGYVDMVKYPIWNKTKKELSGTSNVIKNEDYKIIIALNNYQCEDCIAEGTPCQLKIIDKINGLAELTLKSLENKAVAWKIMFKSY